ncbi:hypothetical protein BC826DRAFT_323195 [Russula brevipes]|nr:hypothetical protein BC826DRAFT_323195 [Russula brevipes]
MGVSSERSNDKPGADSSAPPSGRASPHPPSLHSSEKLGRARGHYRGPTFEEILPPHLITNAPPPGADEKQGRSKKSNENRSTSSATAEQRPSPIKRSYPSIKHSPSGGKSRFGVGAKARALVRGLTSRRKSRAVSGYEVVV